MGLKQIKPIDRITFLKQFVGEIMITLSEKDPSKKIEVEKLKQKFLLELETPEDSFKKAINTPIFEKPVYAKELGISKEKELPKIPRHLRKRKKIIRRARIFRPAPKKQPIKPIIHRSVANMLQKQPLQQKQQPVQQVNQTPQAKALGEVLPEANFRPSNLSLNKIDVLLKDSSIQSIECPGPGRNILVKRYNKINITKIKLTKQEIIDIVSSFSQEARIPIVGGILKAAVGDLVVSAIMSDFVGSRFIINKITPYHIIGQ